MNRPDIIATRLRKAREARGLKREDLAELVPCSSSIIGSIERQERGLTVAMAVAIGRILQVKPAWLLDLEE